MYDNNNFRFYLFYVNDYNESRFTIWILYFKEVLIQTVKLFSKYIIEISKDTFTYLYNALVSLPYILSSAYILLLIVH